MSLEEQSIKLHRKLKGKLEIKSKIPVKSMKMLSLLYTPGVAQASRNIAKEKNQVYNLTSKWNLVAIVSDGSRVLGLGNIGAEAALPVMEGKAILFKLFGNVDAFPLCIKTQKASEIIELVKNISPTFGGINIEDIESPKCFEITDRLNKELDMPVFHDDRQGTGIVALAGLINSLKVVKKRSKNIKIVIGGAGAAGYGIMEILLEYSFRNLILTDSSGIIYKGRKENMNKYKEKMANKTNKEKIRGSLSDALTEADVFIGVTGVANSISKEMLKQMNKKSVVFALTNPNPEIYPKEAKKARVKIFATGRSDFPNQINNSLAFPGVFRGALDVRAKRINMQMQISAAKALARMVKNPSVRNIIPKTTDPKIMKVIAKAVSKAAKESKVARLS